MPRASRPRWSSRAGLALTALVVFSPRAGSIALIKARASTERARATVKQRAQSDGGAGFDRQP